MRAGRRDPRSEPWRLALSRLRRSRSFILCHHGVGVSTREQDPLMLQVPPERLRKQLELLGSAGYEFTTVAGLMELAGDGPPPPGYAVLSFDDGMADNHAAALPLLRELGVPATFYIATGFIGGDNPFLPGTRMMTPEELRELAAAGMELGAHTVTHPNMAELDYDASLKEMADSRDQLAAATGVTATTFAYPFGAYAEPARLAARDAGFAAAVAANNFGDPGDRYAIPRALLWGRDRTPSFLAKLTGAWWPFFEHPAVRFARERTRGARRLGRELLDRHGRG